MSRPHARNDFIALRLRDLTSDKPITSEAPKGLTIILDFVVSLILGVRSLTHIIVDPERTRVIGDKVRRGDSRRDRRVQVLAAPCVENTPLIFHTYIERKERITRVKKRSGHAKTRTAIDRHRIGGNDWP